MKTIVLFALVAIATASALKVKAPKTNTNGVRMTKASKSDPVVLLSILHTYNASLCSLR